MVVVEEYDSSIEKASERALTRNMSKTCVTEKYDVVGFQ